MYWKFIEDQGAWEAFGEFGRQYRIEVCSDGSFDYYRCDGHFPAKGAAGSLLAACREADEIELNLLALRGFEVDHDNRTNN